MKNVTVLCSGVDDFCQVFMPVWIKPLLSEDKPRRNRCFVMSPAEVMTILILFHRSNYRNLKSFYTEYIPFMYGNAFPHRIFIIVLLN